MKTNTVIRFMAIWVLAATVIFAAAMVVGTRWVSADAAGFIAAAMIGFVVALILGAGSLLMVSALLKAGMIDREEARSLSDTLISAQEGDLATPWRDIHLQVNGERRLIPLAAVYERLVGVMVEADRMGNQLNRLSHEILNQATMLSEGAEDQRTSVVESTTSVSRIDASAREVLANISDLAELGDNVSSSSYQMMASIDEVNRTVQALNQSVREAVSAIQEITGSIHSVAEAAESLSGAAAQSQSSMETIDQATRTIRDRADNAARLSEDSRSGAEHSKQLLASAVGKIRLLADSVESTRQVMQELGVQSRSIGEILTVISSVTADTHLLSLNASIMAAKAGEHGRGFAVVAQEIKTLAHRTAQSAKEIENLILETQGSADRAIRAIEEGSARAAESMGISEDADKALADVLKRAQIAAENAHQIARDTEGQAAMSARVFKAVDEVAKRAELIRAAMREQEDSINFVQGRSIAMKENMDSVAQAMSEQAEASSRISESMEGLTSRIQSIRQSTEEQARSSQGIVQSIHVIRRKADLVAIGAQNVSNTSMSVLHQSHLLQHELKGISLPAREGRLNFGILLDNLREERWRREKEIFETRARELGVNTEIRVAEGNARKQREQGDELLALGVDLIILVAVDAEDAGAIVKKAREAGTPVIVYDRLVKNAKIDLFVSFDARLIGEIQASTAVEKAAGNRLLILQGSPTDVNSQFLYQGQMKFLKPLLDAGKVNVVDEIWTPDWDPGQAYMLTRQALENKGPIHAVIAANDGTAGGAVRAIKEAVPDQRVVVTGMDTELAACRRIVEGSQEMTVYMPIKLQATRTMEAALLMLKDEDIPGITHHLDNGAGRVPSILLKPIKIDRENLEEVVVKDGFHKREDIYS